MCVRKRSVPESKVCRQISVAEKNVCVKMGSVPESKVCRQISVERTCLMAEQLPPSSQPLSLLCLYLWCFFSFFISIRIHGCICMCTLLLIFMKCICLADKLLFFQTSIVFVFSLLVICIRVFCFWYWYFCAYFLYL